MTMKIGDEFEEILRFKRNGGQTLEIHVSKSIWLGGLQEDRPHEPMVAIGPADWDGEEELTFFKNKSEVSDFIEALQMASEEAWPS